MNLQITILFIWLIYIIFWIILSFKTKKTEVRHNGILGGWIPRILVVVILIILLSIPSLSIIVLPESLSIIGLIIFLSGITFSIYARCVLGLNWSSNLEIKEKHELIISGPYKIVRHPIYTGVILGLLGTFLVFNKLNILIFLVIVAIGIIMRSKVEDRLMEEKFNKEYIIYRTKVKSLIPYIY